MIFKRKYAAALAAALMVTTAGITAQAFDADTGIVVPVYGLDDSGVHLYDAHIIANDIQTVMNGEDMELGTLNVNKLTIQGQEIASSDDITNIKEDITNLQDTKVRIQKLIIVRWNRSLRIRMIICSEYSRILRKICKEYRNSWAVRSIRPTRRSELLTVNCSRKRLTAQKAIRPC